MEPWIHLVVEAGPERGREIHIPAAGVRIGRSSRNDVALNDPSLSRFHCRLYFKPDDGLWVADLGSSNETLLNGKPVEDGRVGPNDEITIGDTTLRVRSDRYPLKATAAALGIPGPSLVPGFERPPVRSPANHLRGPLIGTVVVLALVALLVWVPWASVMEEIGGLRRPATTVPVALPLLDVTYERVEATASNIFRYSMQIQRQTLVVQIDDLQHDRHVRRETKLNVAQMRDLAGSVEAAGFFELFPAYLKLISGVYVLSDIRVTIGARTHRCRVLNRVEPEPLAIVRRQLDAFGKRELGLAVLAVEPEAP